MINIDIVKLDIDKYLDWLFNSAPIEQKEQIEVKEKYPDISFWKPPTESEKKSINYLKERTFEFQKATFEEKLKSSPLSTLELYENEFNKVVNINNSKYQNIQGNIINGYVVSNWIELGEYCGHIDYLKFLSEKLEEENLTVSKIKWTGSQAELITIFYDLLDAGLLKCAKTQLYRLIEQNFIDKENKQISKSYIEKLFKPDSIEDRSKKRIKLNELL
jgi:hypothetical protein